MSVTKVFGRRCGIVLAAVLYLSFTVAPTTVFGLTQDDLNSIINDTPFYDSSGTDVCSTGSATAASAPTSSTSNWNSTVQPPYYLEIFVINVLEDVAQKLNVPASSAVTQQHVLALVAWAYAEGGNIANTSAFNPWNTGLTDRPDLLAGSGNSSGLQSFNSFNSGVEANAISMTTPNESRIGQILIQPGSSAQDVLHTIAYYDETSGNLAWAWGPNASDPSAVLQFNHTVYITSLTDQLTSAEQNYSSEASVVIGPGEENTQHVSPSQLEYSGNSQGGNSLAGDATFGCGSSGGSANCTTVSGNAKILCAAEAYSGIYYEWGGGHQGYSAFISACPDPSNPPDNEPSGGAVNGDPGGLSGNPSPCATDCSGLVSIATDTAFGQNFDWNVGSLESSPDWKQINISSVSAGDVVVVGSVHIEIVDHYDSSSGQLYTFGSHFTGTQTSEIDSTLSSWTAAYRYVGPGSSGN